MNVLPASENHWTKLRLLKIAFAIAARKVRDLDRNRGAKTVEERIFWSIQALRGLRTNDTRMIDNAMAACPQIRPEKYTKRHLFSAGDVEQIRKVLQSSMQMSLEEKQEELDSLVHLTEYEKKSRQQTMAEKVAQWSPKRRKAGIQGILDKDGNLISSPEEARTCLIGHWANVFEDKHIDTEKAETFLRRHSKPFHVDNWIVEKSVFRETVMKCAHSAPGPDGIPYAAWQGCMEICLDALYDCFTDWVINAKLSKDFNVAFLWLPPKGNPEEPKKPKDTRPLTGSNSDSKIFAMNLKIPIDKELPRWAFKGQRGFISDRVMIENAIEVESEGIALAYSHSCAAMLFFDFAAAFPSIARSFMWLALAAIGLPLHIILALRALYDNNHHYVSWNGTLFFAFTSRSGVRQGCPLSSVFFIGDRFIVEGPECWSSQTLPTQRIRRRSCCFGHRFLEICPNAVFAI